MKTGTLSPFSTLTFLSLFWSNPYSILPAPTSSTLDETRTTHITYLVLSRLFLYHGLLGFVWLPCVCTEIINIFQWISQNCWMCSCEYTAFGTGYVPLSYRKKVGGREKVETCSQREPFSHWRWQWCWQQSVGMKILLSWDITAYVYYMRTVYPLIIVKQLAPYTAEYLCILKKTGLSLSAPAPL